MNLQLMIRKSLAILSVYAVFVPSLSQAAQNLQYNCRAMTYEEGTQVGWMYDFRAYGIQAAKGTPFIRSSPTLTVSRFKGPLYSDKVDRKTYMTNKTLGFVGASSEYVTFNLPKSVHGLTVNFFPNANDNGGDLTVIHNLNANETVISRNALSLCNVSRF